MVDLGHAVAPPEARLSPSSYAVLGVVALRGPSTPYDLKRALGRVANEFWSVPHTQCYTETERLAGAGLVAGSLAVRHAR